MLETNKMDLGFEVDGSAIAVFPGTARVGNTVLPFRGDRLGFSSMVDFAPDTSVYQHSVLFLQDFGGVADLTTAVSATADNTNDLVLPELPYDSSSPYAPVHPIGLFTFWTPDGTDIDLISYSKVV